MKRSKIAVLGGGSWGTTTASVISRQCNAVLWARDAQIVDEINQHHTNTRYLANRRRGPDSQQMPYRKYQPSSHPPFQLEHNLIYLDKNQLIVRI